MAARLPPALLLLLLAGPVFAERDCLVKVDLTTPKQRDQLTARAVRVLTDQTGCVLALMSEPEISDLGRQFPLTVLDETRPDRCYFLVFPVNRLGIESLSSLGTVLCSFSPTPGEAETQRPILFSTTEERVIELNRLPVELYRLPMAPIRSTVGPAVNEARPPTALSDTLIREIVNRVNEDSVMATIRRLQDYRTRYATTDSCRAAVNYALARMQAYGCDSAYSDTWQTGYAPNGIGVKIGQTNPRRIYALCAHIDNTSEQAPGFCPGADDNGSGVATVLEACRVLADYDFDYTFRFLIFTGEEQGLLGSAAYCSEAAARGDSILGAMNFDMVSYGLAGRDSMVFWKRTANPNCTLLANVWIATADTYTTLKYWVYSLSSGGQTSDHASFWQNGYPCIRNKESDVTPMYHTTADTIGVLHFPGCGTNDVPITVEAIKAAVATFASLAGVRPLTAVGDRSSPTAHHRVQAFPSLFRDRVTFRLPPGTRELRIFDAGGRLVRTMTVSAAAAVWDGCDMASRPVAPGIYFYRMGISGGRLVKAGERD